MSDKESHIVTLEQHTTELLRRVPPILNIDLVIVKDGKYLIGRRPKGYEDKSRGYWLFPGGRMRWDETIEQAVTRKLKQETGINAVLRKLILAVSEIGHDPRAHGVTLYYLLDYRSGKPKVNPQFDAFRWVSPAQLLRMPRSDSLQKSFVSEIEATIRTQNTSEDELLVEVNSRDRKIGTIGRRTAHATNKRYHRAAHIFIFNSRGETILQQRSLNKPTSPGKWDMPGGHQVAGQKIEQTAMLELLEEMGVTPKLCFVGKHLKKTATQAEWCYLYYGISDGPYAFDRNEVQAVRAFDPRKLIAGGYRRFPILDHVVDYLKQLRPVWEKLRRARVASTFSERARKIR